MESMAFLLTPTGPNHVKITINISEPRISRGPKKRLKISLFSVSFFDRFGSSKWTPKCPKIEPQRPPRRSWSQVAAGSWFRSHFWSFLGPLGTPKIMLSLWRGAIFANFVSRAREPEIAPQMVPKSSLKRPPEAPEWPEMSLQIGARILIKFQLRF